MFLAHSNQKYVENVSLGPSPVVPVVLAIPTVLCRTHQQVFQHMFNKYAPTLPQGLSTAMLLTEVRSDQLCWSCSSPGPGGAGASCKQHSMVTRPWEPNVPTDPPNTDTNLQPSRQQESAQLPLCERGKAGFSQSWQPANPSQPEFRPLTSNVHPK